MTDDDLYDLADNLVHELPLYHDRFDIHDHEQCLQTILTAFRKAIVKTGTKEWKTKESQPIGQDLLGKWVAIGQGLSGGPIPLAHTQEQAVKEWAADDRLWTTQDTVEINLRTFARGILKEPCVALARLQPPKEER